MIIVTMALAVDVAWFCLGIILIGVEPVQGPRSNGIKVVSGLLSCGMLALNMAALVWWWLQ